MKRRNFIKSTIASVIAMPFLSLTSAKSIVEVPKYYWEGIENKYIWTPQEINDFGFHFVYFPSWCVNLNKTDKPYYWDDVKDNVDFDASLKDGKWMVAKSRRTSAWIADIKDYRNDIEAKNLMDEYLVYELNKQNIKYIYQIYLQDSGHKVNLYNYRTWGEVWVRGARLNKVA
jgi:hypothetical protein